MIPAGRLAAVATDWHTAGSRVVFTNGCFDLLHPGHLALLAGAAEYGDVLVVAINSDRSVRRLKGTGRPVYPQNERAETLRAIRWVDAVTVFDDDTPERAIDSIRPDVLVKGGEYGPGEIVGEDFVASYGGTTIRYPMEAGYGTTQIVDRLRNGREK